MKNNMTHTEVGVFMAYEEKPMQLQLNTFDKLEYNEIPLVPPMYSRINHNLCFVDVCKNEFINEGDLLLNSLTFKTLVAEFGGDYPDHIFKVLYCSDKEQCQNGIKIIPTNFIERFIKEYNNGIVIKEIDLKNEIISVWKELYTEKEMISKLTKLHDDMADRMVSGFIDLEAWLSKNITGC